MGPEIIVAIIAAVGGGGIFKVISDWRTGKTDNWSKLAEAYSRQMADMAATYGSLEARLERVESDLDVERQRSNAAVGYIRVLRRWIMDKYPGEEIPEVPDKLRNDV